MIEKTHDQKGQIPFSGSVLGVDVGFSPKERSSAVCRLDWNATEIRLTIDRFRALEPERSTVLSAVADRPIMVASFDGPLNSTLEIIGEYRLAEELLTRKLWPKIGKPGQSNSPVGIKLNAAANQCAKIILDFNLVSASVHDHAIHPAAIVEAFPTSFLGLLIDDPESLLAHSGAKSDKFFVYLEKNGELKRLIEHYLPGRYLTKELSTIKNHDDRAAVVCALTSLAVAAGDYVAVGDHKHGWMIMPPRSFIQDWAWKLLQQNAQPQGGLEWRLRTARPTAGERLDMPRIADVGAKQATSGAKMMAWFFWDEASNKLNEVHWTRLEHHPDFSFKNGVHIRQAGNHVELWVQAETRERALEKMQGALPTPKG